MILGFTGTQDGMTYPQKFFFEGILARLSPREFHHGDCIGADCDAHKIVERLLPKCIIVGHPPDSDAKRAFCKCHERRPPKPYLVRNKAIVFSVDSMCAAPKSRTEELRSGTWATIRYARKVGKHLIMLWP